MFIIICRCIVNNNESKTGYESRPPGISHRLTSLTSVQQGQWCISELILF